MAYQLISFVLCPYVQRSVITLKEKQVPFDITYIDLNNPPDWLLAISPMGKVPVLRMDQDRVLFESAVINEYLDETNPPPLHPQDPWRRAHNRAWIEFGSSMLASQYRLLMAADETALAQERDELLADLQHVERQLNEGPFFNGAVFSLVDAAYAPLLWRFDLMERRYPQGLFAKTPKVAAWCAALMAKPAVRDSVVPDFEEQFTTYYAEHGGLLARKLV